MSKIEAISSIANVAGSIVNGIAGAKTKRLLAQTGDKVQQEQNEHDELIASLNMRNQNSFQAINRTKFDSFVDGLNRLVFPLTAFPFVFLLWKLIIKNPDSLLNTLGTWGLLSVISVLLGVRQIGKHYNSKKEEKIIENLPQKDDVKTDQKIEFSKNNDVQKISTNSSLKKVRNFVEKFGIFAEKINEQFYLPIDGIMAHAALETGWGEHILIGYDTRTKEKIETNNIFNIKTNSEWRGKAIVKKAWEVKNGKIIDEKSTFKAYDDILEAFQDYAILLSTKERYKPVLNTKNATEYGKALYDCGYMTDNKAPEKIAKIAKKYFIIN